MMSFTNFEAEEIKTLALKGKLGEIIKTIQKKDSTLSKNKLCQILECKESNLNRWFKKENTFSMTAFIKLINYIDFDKAYLLDSINDTETFYAPNLPKTYKGSIIWTDLKKNQLVNCLYFYRKYLNPMSVFKMAYMLKIDPRTLLNYESGREKIPGELWEKICNALHLKLEELFPAFVTYDNGNTYSLMHPFDLKWTFNLLIDEVNIDGYTLDISEVYMYSQKEELSPIVFIWQIPLKRYSGNGEVINTVLINKITMDEYYNAEDEMLLDSELNQIIIKYPFNDLPPYYYRKDKIWIRRIQLEEYFTARYFDNKPVESIEFDHPYTIKLKFKDQKQEKFLNMKRYAESKSLWYQQLQDFNYFCKGKIIIDSGIYCIVWPNGQYIATGDWLMDERKSLPDKRYNSIKSIRFSLRPKYNNEPWKF